MQKREFVKLTEDRKGFLGYTTVKARKYEPHSTGWKRPVKHYNIQALGTVNIFKRTTLRAGNLEE